ncbi:MAG: glycosyltransferase [Candidatus Wildermuthbacteria bacterium]|nr:glycosyltransferase [Candidatus Wildermuthbacteria bacterium]
MIVIPEKKKVLFFIATLAHGGAERLISELSLRLHNCDVVIVISENKVSYRYKGKLVVLGVSFPQSFFPKVYCYFRRFLKLRSIVVKEKPDYVVSFGAYANLLNVFLPSKVILHTDAYYSGGRFRGTFYGLFLHLFARFFYNRAEKVVPMSYLAAQDLQENYGVRKEKIQMIYNALTLRKVEMLSEEPLEKNFEELFSHPVVITVGRLVKEKGQWHLIKAFKRFKETVPNAKLVILGEGALKVSLEELAQDLGIEKDVHFLGWQDNPFSFLARSSMFVLSSHTEGLPTVLLEALACGVPIVSADCKSGPREILAPATDVQKEAKEIEIGEYGLLVPPLQETFPFSKDAMLSKNEEIFAEAMALLYQNTFLRKHLRKKARKRIEDFRMNNILKYWNSLFGYGKLEDTKL